jgi:hypothetical protein
LHKLLLFLSLIPVSSCSLCPWESLFAKWGDSSTLWTFSQLCQGPTVVSRHQLGIQNSKQGSNRNAAGRSQCAALPPEKHRCPLQIGGQNFCVHNTRGTCWQAGRVAQVVDCLPSKDEALSSNSSTAKKKKKNLVGSSYSTVL